MNFNLSPQDSNNLRKINDCAQIFSEEIVLYFLKNKIELARNFNTLISKHYK
jgi:hypothetical protein